MITEELKFIPHCLKPFKESQSGFILASGMYLDALKKIFSNINKLVSLSTDEIRYSLKEIPTISNIVSWGTCVAHDFGEDIEIEFAVDELPIGKIWDLFQHDSVIEDLIETLNEIKQNLEQHNQKL